MMSGGDKGVERTSQKNEGWPMESRLEREGNNDKRGQRTKNEDSGNN